MIKFDAVSKRYPNGTTAVDDLSLDFPEGGVTVLVGSSGCGKTTTLRMINRMVDPTSGTISVGGRDILEADAAELRRGIGYVIQQSGLFPHRTILDNIATVPLLLGWGRRKARARAAELLELVGLPADSGKRYPHQLSGGQQQRVGVARALAADPPVLLMDEPFGAVDPVVRTQLQNELLRLQEELRRPSSSSPTTSTRPSASVTASPSSAPAATSSSAPSPPSCWPVPPTISSPTSWAPSAA